MGGNGGPAGQVKKADQVPNQPDNANLKKKDFLLTMDKFKEDLRAIIKEDDKNQESDNLTNSDLLAKFLALEIRVTKLEKENADLRKTIGEMSSSSSSLSSSLLPSSSSSAPASNSYAAAASQAPLLLPTKKINKVTKEG